MKSKYLLYYPRINTIPAYIEAAVRRKRLASVLANPLTTLEN